MTYPSESTIKTDSDTHLHAIDFGLADYNTIWEQQQALVAQRVAGEIPDTMLSGEHHPVYTLGRGSRPENVFQPQFPVLAVERGGDVTYHGPGQLIVYPVVLLPVERRDLHRWLRLLEEAVILTLAHYDVEGFRLDGKTGVWVSHKNSPEPKKIASIGVAVRKWVTYHGLALNINPDLSHFNAINPCGFESSVMTSLSEVPGKIVSARDVLPVMRDQLQALLRQMLA